MNKFKDQKGYSLVELVISLPLSILVVIIAAFAIINFVRTYNEVKLYTQLQEDLFNAVETMRYGYTKTSVTGGIASPESEKEGLIGLMTAKEVEIDHSGRLISIKPISVDPGIEYRSTFFLDENNNLRTSGQYGIKIYQNELVFPSTLKKIGNEQQFQLIELKFERKKVYNNRIHLLGIEIIAQVRFREKEEHQSIEDDRQVNTKTIKYKTSVYIANAKSET